MGLSNTLLYLLTAYVRYSINTVSNTLFYLLTTYTDVFTTYRTITVYKTFLLKMIPQVRNMKKTSKLKIKNTNLDYVHSDGLYCIIVLQSMVQ